MTLLTAAISLRALLGPNALGRIGDVRAILILQKLADTDPYVNDFDKPGQLFRRGRL